MNKIRSYERYDETTVRKIHEKHFKEEFSAPDFFSKFHAVFTIENENGIICVGGVRPILEGVIITDKDRTPIERKSAFNQMLEAQTYVGSRLGYDQLHAFIHDPKWSNRLQRTYKFRPTRGQSLYLDI